MTQEPAQTELAHTAEEPRCSGTNIDQIASELRGLFVAGDHTQEIWDHVDDILTATENLTYLRELASGGLDHKVFTNYLLQDELYLDAYARAMTLLAAGANDSADTQFWAKAAGEAVAVENDMHAALLDSDEFAQFVCELSDEHGQPVASPTTLGYASYLVATAATRPYAVGVAGVLPCFWVYAHVGKVLTRMVGTSMDTHPFKEWISAYDSAEFDASTRGAVAILERELAQATPAVRQEMFQTFRQACMFELHFWATAREIQRFELLS